MCKKFGQAGQDKDKTCLFAPVKNIVKKLKKKLWTEQIEKKQISSLNVSLNVQFGPMDRVFSFFLFLIFSNLLKSFFAQKLLRTARSPPRCHTAARIWTGWTGQG
jgi:hypothetical protein